MDQTTTKTTRLNRLLTTVLVSGAFWPVFVWYAARTFDKSDEPWGLIALVTALAILIAGLNRKPESTEEKCKAESSGFDLIAGTAVLAIYVMTYSVAPNLVQSILLVLAIWFLIISGLASPPLKSGLLGLLLLSLPLIPSLNFFLGYPLRVIVAEGTCLMLTNLGMSATREGVMLAVNGHLTAIDAPCSGVNMLWAESYMVMLVACKHKLDMQRTLLLAVIALVLVILANILRTSTLVAFDKIASANIFEKIAQLEPSVHLGAGLLCFGGVCGLTIITAAALASRLQPKPKTPSTFFASLNLRRLPWGANIHSIQRVLLIPLCLAAAVTPLLSHPGGSTSTVEAAPNWPAEINGNKVVSVDSLGEEKSFAHEFPGQMKRFTDGTNSYFVRLLKETRQLHPSSDCFKGLGYKVEPQPIVVGNDGKRWGAFEATKLNSRYLILERIYDEHGHSSTDVSEWYWLACLGKTHGPWFDITIAQPLHSR